MFRCYIYFADLKSTGKYSQLVSRIYPNVEIYRILKADQIQQTFDVAKKNILVTAKELHEGVNRENNFELTLVIDPNEDRDDEANKTYFMTPGLFITSARSALTKFFRTHVGNIDYIPFDISKINIEKLYPCDFYLRINNEKHLKLMRAEDKIDPATIKKLTEKNVQNLYVSSEQYNLLVSFLDKENKSESKESKEVEEFEQDTQAIETIHDYIQDLGVSEEVIHFTKNLHSEMEKKLDDRFLKKLLSRFASMEGSLLYNHSYLTAVVCLSVGKKYTWMNFANKEKLFMGSILHDLGIKNKNNATFENMAKVSLSTLDDAIQEDVLSHPVLFAKKLAQIKDIHQDIIKIVKDHHGVHNKNSYPHEVYPNEINLIFALFTLGHEFSLKFCKSNKTKDDVEQILYVIQKHFNKGNYKKILPEFIGTIEGLF